MENIFDSIIEKSFRGLKLHKENFKGKKFFSCDFSNSYLKGADLSGVVFSGANLKDVNLSNAYLNNCEFYKTDLSYSNLKNANLIESDLSYLADLANYELIRDIAKIVLEDPRRLNMVEWHTCNTTHCIAGWATHLTPRGYEMENYLGTDNLAYFILGETACKEFWKSTEEALAFLREVLNNA